MEVNHHGDHNIYMFVSNISAIICILSDLIIPGIYNARVFVKNGIPVCLRFSLLIRLVFVASYLC